jgi:D-glycero-D-manno-heptose 1,7-bisphosphate phosphatase
MSSPGETEPRRSRRRAVFLDRDGVLNGSVLIEGRPHPPESLAQAKLLPGVAEACRMLRDAGLLLICVTNQPDIRRKTLSEFAVNEINDWLKTTLELTDVRVCPHDDSDDCACRKPRPGLLLMAAADHDVDLTKSVMVGDRWRDVSAARNAGCVAIFIDHHYDERRPEEPDFVFPSLLAAVPTILECVRKEP